MSETLTCPGCNAAVAEDWRFCVECGTERPGLYDPVPEAVATMNGHPVSEPEQAEAPPEPLPGGSEVRWRAVESLAVYLLALVAFYLVAQVVVASFGPEPTPAEEDAETAILLPLLQLCLGGSVALWLRFRHRVGLSALGLRMPRGGDVGAGVAWGFLGVGASATIAWIVFKIAEVASDSRPADPEQIPIASHDPALAFWITIAISTVLLAPLVEEMFFRGMLHQGLRRRYRFVPSVLVSGLVFASVHFDPSQPTTLLIVPSLFALAGILASSYERSGSLWTPVAAHATFNLVGFVSMLVRTSS